MSGAQTAGRYCLIDMLVPAGGDAGPIATTSRKCSRCSKANSSSPFAESRTPYARDRPSRPANAPHAFKNLSGKTARMLCMCTPAGQDEFFLAVGFPVEGRTSPPPKPTPEEMAEKGKLIAALLPKYRTEMVKM